MKKRLMMALAAGALVAAMLPGVAAAGGIPDFEHFILVPGNNQLAGKWDVGVPEAAWEAFNTHR